MKKVEWDGLPPAGRKAILARPTFTAGPAVAESVSEIIAMVRERGDAALYDLTRRFDGVELNSIGLPQSQPELNGFSIDELSKDAILAAKNSIAKFHEAQLLPPLVVETIPGVECRLVRRPIQSVGLYVPGGSAPLVSSLLMMAVPASLVGCERVVVCSPPPVDPAILFAANLCEVTEIYQIGGAQAIAAMAFGTETIAPVSKIFGPGNSYVSTAKQQVAATPGGPAIDIVAGPTELLVIADQTAEPAFIAADLLSQAEHGADSQVILATTSEELAKSVTEELKDQIESLPRASTARACLNNSVVILCRDLDTAVAIANEYCPEHLIVSVEDCDPVADKIVNAGSIFLGAWSPESVGDYASGTNHVLPTGGSAAACSGLTVNDFQKTISVQKLTEEGLGRIGPVVEQLAAMEQLSGHSRAVSIRLQAIADRSRGCEL